ncbi:MAG: hypothetical protein EXS16_10050 [Gemmataceae bacterium]|nr:hypothetical protein [Gemmataceae bacterium]
MADNSPTAGQPARARNVVAPKIDTTPTLPEPSADSIDLASREIPCILANVKPRRDNSIEMIASRLAKRLQDAGHILAAAYWAIHQSVKAGRLRAALIETELPSVASRNPGQGGSGRIWHGGEKGIVAIPNGQPTPFDCFKVVATESLWEWWRSNKQGSTNPQTPGGMSGEKGKPETETGDTPPAKSKKRKRSTKKGEARDKLIAALLLHHKYEDDGCLNWQPIGNNDLARSAGNVSPTSAKLFFDKYFGIDSGAPGKKAKKTDGHSQYRVLCMRNPNKVLKVLKFLNGDFAVDDTYGDSPPTN